MNTPEVVLEAGLEQPLPAEPPVASVRRRYLVTLMAQALQLMLSVITAGIVPKVLGPVTFGNYNFLLSMSANIRNFLDLGTQQAFFTFSSKERASGGLTRLFGLGLAIQFLVTLVLIAGFAFLKKTHVLWPGQHVDQILFVTGLEWLIFLSLMLRQLGDTKGLTVQAQRIAAVSCLFSAAGIVTLFHWHRLNLFFYVGILYAANLLSCAALAYTLLIRHGALCWAGSLQTHFRAYARKWWTFASPLVVYGLYATLVAGVDTYLIQRLYGASEQAYFSLAMRWSSLVMVFTTSIVTIYWRELASAIASGQNARVGTIYVRFNHVMFFLAATLGCWLCLNARFVVLTFAGRQYLAAIPVLMIMAFYPVAQTIGQLTSVAFLASERTQQYRNVGILLSIPSLIMTYVVLAPRDALIPGLQLGVLGIAAKTVGLAMLNVLIYDWLNIKYLKLAGQSVIMDKLKSACCLGALAAAVFLSFPTPGFHGDMAPSFASVALRSTLYFVLVILAVAWRPQVAGLRPDDISSVFSMLKKVIPRDAV